MCTLTVPLRQNRTRKAQSEGVPEANSLAWVFFEGVRFADATPNHQRHRRDQDRALWAREVGCSGLGTTDTSVEDRHKESSEVHRQPKVFNKVLTSLVTLTVSKKWPKCKASRSQARWTRGIAHHIDLSSGKSRVLPRPYAEMTR